jgi:hypothetical protein
MAAFSVLSTGTTSTGTSGSSPVVLFKSVTGNFCEVQATNEGEIDCFLSFDGGTSYAIVPASTARLFRDVFLNGATIQISRGSAVSDVTGFYLDGH